MNFAHDDWIPKLDLLSRQLLPGSNFPEHATVSKFVTDFGGWD